MDISAAFPSKWLKSDDLQGHEITVTLDRVETEEIGDGSKPVAYFEGKAKGLVLNKINAQTIAKAYGNKTEGWKGKQIILYPATTQFQGGIVDCIRIRTPAKVAMDDEIPF